MSHEQSDTWYDNKEELEAAENMLNWLAGKRKGSEIVDKAIKAELERLTELWEAR